MYACAAGVQSEAEGKSKPVTIETKEGVIDGAVDHEYHEWVEPEPPVGILKSSSYVSGDESEAEQVGPTTDDSKQQDRKKGGRAGRKLVPVWRLVSRSLNNSQTHYS